MNTKEFTLPKKWCVRAHPETVETLAKYWDKGCNTTCYTSGGGEYKHRYWHSHNLTSGNSLFSDNPGANHVSSNIQEGFIEITFEQFKEHVLKEPIIYTIQDLSEGKVICVNDGTLEELQEVIEAAFLKDTHEIIGGAKYYTKSIYYDNSWMVDDYNTELPTQSVKVFYKQLKNNTMNTNKIFPLTLTPSDAKAIIRLACKTWKTELADYWAKQIVLNENILVSKEYYMKMRKACTEEQHKLFDDIFGKDETFPLKGTICRVWDNDINKNITFLRISDGNGKFFNDGKDGIKDKSHLWENYEVLTSLHQFK